MGWAKRSVTKFFLEHCQCIDKTFHKIVKCPCPKSRTYRHKCKKGERKVTTHYFVRDSSKKCRMKKRKHVEICEHKPNWRPKFACQCYHYGKGNILTFDKRRFLASTAGKCSFLLSSWVNSKSMCSYQIFAVSMRGKFNGQLIKFLNNEYLLTNHKKLYVNGNHHKLPYYHRKIRIFVSGEYLQFVSPHCNLAVAYNGHGGGYLSVGLFKKHGFKGLCGNCNGNPLDDQMDKNYVGGRDCKLVSGMKKFHKCMKHHSNEVGKKYCGRLSGQIRSNFLKCSKIAFHFYRGCIKDVCSVWPDKKKMYKSACQTHSIAAEACSDKGKLVLWRSVKFCPIDCGPTKIFVSKMNPCPKTCENYFFRTSKRCFKLPRRNGCDCSHGHVLDGNLCVKPTECKCLRDVCLDRMSRSKCKAWRDQGRCSKDRKVMSEFCRLTCGFCKVKCQDQIASKVCRYIKLKGKCQHDFYKQMCRLTCYPKSCKCPDCKTIRSRCHPKYKYMIVKKVCYKLNRRGKCIPIVSRSYNTCGVCPEQPTLRRTKCNFCKGYRLAITTKHFRDKSKKRMCKSVKTHVKEICKCRYEQGSFTRCMKNQQLIRVSYKYGDLRCQKCIKRTVTKILKEANCKGTWMTSTRCNHKTGKRLVSYHKSVASDCKCLYSVKKAEVWCKCPKIKRKGPICKGNDHWVFYQIGFKMTGKGRCEKVVSQYKKYLKCPKRNKVIYKCNRKNCIKTRYIEKWTAQQCQCRLSVEKKEVGKCCCPRPSYSKTPCLGYYKLMKKKIFILLNNECILRVLQKKIRCRCPRKKKIKFCDFRRGHIVKGMIRYRLTKEKTCRKLTWTRKLPIVCQKVRMHQTTPCVFTHGRHSKMKFRKIIFRSLIRRGCSCVPKVKVYLEPCGCKNLKHVKIIPCPKKCLRSFKSSKHCPRNCYSVKKFYRYRLLRYQRGRHSKKCIPELVKVQRKLCCCKSNKRVRTKCVKHKFVKVMTKEKMFSGEKHCSVFRKEHLQRVKCPVGFIKQVVGKKYKNGKMVIIKIYGYIKHCKCKRRIKKSLCVWKCPHKSMRKYCDKHRKSVVKVIKYRVPRKCHCEKRMKTERKRIFCPRYKKKIGVKCSKHSKLGYVVYLKKYQRGCHCAQRKIYKKFVCKCPSGYKTSPKCAYGKSWMWKIIYFVKHHKRCEKKMKLRRKRVHCPGHTKIHQKCLSNGIFLKIKSYMILKHCKCIKRSRVVFKGKCHCKNQKMHERIKCHPKGHKWLKIRTFFLHDKWRKKCVRKTSVSEKPVYCHRAETHRSKCDLVNKKRQYVHRYYLRKHCGCIPRKRVWFKKCGCRKGKVQHRRFCNKKTGHRIFIKTYKKWIERANKCVRIVRKRKEPIFCKREVRLYKSKCNGKFYMEKMVKKFKNFRTCSCKVRVRVKKRNCHCPTRVLTKKCTKSRGYIGKKLIIFRKWNAKLKKCFTSNTKSFFRRCKCRKGHIRKFCDRKSGKLVTKVLRNRLKHGKCVRETSYHRYHVYCGHRKRYSVSKCDEKKSCLKMITMFSKVLDRKHCRCVWRKKSIKKCKCCGCPKPSVKTRCYKNKYYKTKFTYFRGIEGKCSYRCQLKQSTAIKRFRCHIELPKPHWTKCDKSKCKKQLIGWRIKIRHCKCHKYSFVIKRKTCCCPHKPRKSTYCKHGKIIRSIKYLSLKSHKCRMVVKHRAKRIRCKKWRKKIVKKCNRKTCKQAVFIIKSTLNHSKCHCTKRMSFLYNKPCCCKKKGYKRSFCDGRCIVKKTVWYRFKHGHHTSCVKKVLHRRKCTKCPRVQSMKGHCNHKTCLRYKYHTSFYVRHCKCVKSVKKSAHVCCCPKPLPWTKKCRGNTIVWTKKYHKLKHGNCEKRMRTRKHVVDCHPGSLIRTRRSKCNKYTCLRRITKVTRTQSHCKCGHRVTNYKVRCCCPPPIKSKHCKHNKALISRTQYWELIKSRKTKYHYKCVKRIREYVVRRIKHCPVKHRVGKCDKHRSKKRTIVFIIYKPKHCRCVPAMKRIKKVLCACPQPQRRILKCNRKTCRKTKLFIFFNGPMKHTKRCKRMIRKTTVRCCCKGKKHWSYKKCNRHTGNKEIYTFRRIFDSHRKLCKTKKHLKIIKIKCPKHIQKFTKGCDKKLGLRRIKLTGWKKDKKRCGCRKYHFYRHKLCSCKHKGCTMTKPKCVLDHLLIKKKICHIKQHKKCVPEVSIYKRRVGCPRKHRIRHKCSHKTCLGTKLIYYYQLHRCKCVKKMKVYKYKCCCPSPYKSVKCKRDIFEVKRVQFKYSRHQKTCKKIVVKQSKVIKCRRKLVSHQKCNKHTCKKAAIIKLFKIVHCKCKLIKVHRVFRRCCCPPKRSKTKCFHKYGVIQHVKYNYKLHKSGCVAQKLVEQDKISCKRTKFIRFKCNHHTKKRTIKIISFKRVGCRCRKHIRFMKTLCACKKPRIIKGKCKHHHQSVYQIEYRLKKMKKKAKCVKTVLKLFSDQCTCKPPVITKKCHYNQIRIRKVFYQLLHKGGRKFCHMKDTIRYRALKCPKKRYVLTKCKHFKRKIITIFYRMKHCKCYKHQTVKIRACNCHKRNKNFKYCKNGVVMRVREKYFSTKGIFRCLMHSTYKTKSIKCTKRRSVTPISRKCSSRRGYGYYRHYLMTRYRLVGCKCIKLVKRMKKLCRCAKNVRKIRCIADDTLKIYKRSVVKAGQICLPRKEISTRDIQCNGKEREVKRFSCRKIAKGKCFRKIKITERWVQNCKCRRKSFIVRQRCCVPRPIKRKYCDSKRGQKVSKITVFKLTSGKVIYRKDDFLLMSKKVIKSTTSQRQHIICPSTFVRERCDKKTGKWQRIIGKYKRVGCKCIKKIRRVHGKCKCPPKRVSISKCHFEFQTIRTVEHYLIDRHCVRFSRKKKRRCGCPKPISRIYCDGEGRWVKCMTEFRFSKMYHSCSLEKRCVRWSQMCGEPYVIHGRHCDKRTKKRTIQHISFRRNPHNCKCKKKVALSHQYCSCKHLNRVSTKCDDNVVVTNKKEYTLKMGMCLSTRSQIRRQIKCPRPTIRTSKCNKHPHIKHAGFKWVMKTVFHNVHCRCIKRQKKYLVPCACSIIYKPKSIFYCKHGNTKIKILKYHVLYKSKCIPQQKRFKKDIVCSHKRKYKVSKCFYNRNIKTHLKKISVYGLTVKGCKCVWKLIKSFLKVCKCPHSIKMKKCIKQKIVKKTLIYFVKNKTGKKCIRKQKSRHHTIKCHKRWQTTKCSKSCTLYINLYKLVHHHCKCKVAKSVKFAKCCCPKPTPKRTVCDHRHHRLLTTWYTFDLKYKRCFKRTRKSSYVIHCNRYKPRVKMGKCIKNRRSIYIISKRNQGCKCVNHVKVIKEKCGCPHKIRYHKGHCNRKFTKDKWSGLFFVKFTKKCIRKIIKQRMRRCRCPKPRKIVKCKKDNLRLHIRISFHLQRHSNSCKRIVSRSHLKIRCSTHPRLIHVRRSKCSRSTGYYRTIQKVYRFARKCKCKRMIRRSRYPCNCKKLRHSKRMRRCIKHKYRQTLVKYSVRRGKKCEWKSKKFTKRIICKGLKKRVGKCHKETKHKTIKIYKKFNYKCGCVWRRIKTYNLLCKCPKPTKKVICKHGKVLKKVIKRFYLTKHKCMVKYSQIDIPVHCNEGTKIKQSKCDSFTGFKHIKRITTHVSKCRCLHQTSTRKCRCKCPPKHSYRVCVRHTGQIKTTHVTHSLKKCHCVSHRRVSLIKIKCPRGDIKVTKCRRDMHSYGDLYKWIIRRKYVRHGCKCMKVMKKSRKLCGCKPMVRKHKRCSHDKYILISVTKRVKDFHGKKCRRVLIDSKKKYIECPSNRLRRFCDRKTGVEKIVHIKWRKDHCRCVLKKRIQKGICKCNSNRKFVRIIKCNKHCREVKIFKYKQMHKGKCIYRYEARRRRCCCPKLKSTKTKCIRKMGMVQSVTKTLRFWKGKCLRNYKTKRRVIKCSKSKRVRSHKLPKGTIMIEMKRWKRIGCRCKIVKKIRYRHWRCPSPKKYTKCIDVPVSSKESVSVHHKMMSKVAGCKKVVRVHRIPTDCQPDRTYWTHCKRGKHGYYKMLVHVAHKARKCRCVRSVRMTASLCTCDKPRKVKYCNKHKGMMVQILTNFVPSSRNHKSCAPIKSRQQYRVFCNHHFRYHHKTKCSRKTNKFRHVYKSERRVGCKCKPVWKSKPCICKCPKKKVMKRCRKDNIEEKIVIKWARVGCHCKRLVTSHVHSHHCPHPSYHYGKCDKHTCTRKITRTKYQKKNCRCFKRRFYKKVKCCCPKSKKIKKCVSALGRGKHGKSAAWKWIYIMYKLSGGRCFRSLKMRSQKIICSRRRETRMIGPCRRKKQKYAIITKNAKGCRCVRQVRYVYRSCLCLKKSATEIIFLVDQAVSSRNHMFQRKVRNFLKHVIKMFPLGKHSYRFALVKYSEKPAIIFNLDNRHKHEHLFHGIEKISYTGKRSNLASALKLVKTKILHRTRLGVQKIIYIISDGINDRTSRAAIHHIHWLRRKGVKINGIAVKSNHQGLRFLKKLIFSKLRRQSEHFWSLRKKNEFRQLPYRLLKGICKSACPLAKVRTTKCSKRTHCIGYQYLYGYKNVGKHCLRAVRRRKFECCCNRKPQIKIVCHKNRKLMIKHFWKYRKHTCMKYIMKRDISRSTFKHCKRHQKKRLTNCSKHNYRYLITIKRVVKNCKCHKLIRKKRIRCHCPHTKYMKKCIKNRFVFREKVYFSKINKKCIKRKQISKTPIDCPKPRMEKHKCNRISCHRKISFIKFFVDKCKCRMIRKFIKVKCCCHHNKLKRRYCKKNLKIQRTTWKEFDHRRKTCIRKMKMKVDKTKCSKRTRVKYTKCSMRAGKVYYRLKIVEWKKPENCHCIKLRHVAKLPCRCIKGYSFKRCTSKGIWKRFRVSYRLRRLKQYRSKKVKIVGKCVKKIRVIWSRKHRCNTKTRRRYSKCQKSRYNGEKRRIVHVIRTVRKGCKCRREVRRRVELCKCPKSRKSVKCLKHKYRVVFLVWFQAVRSHGKKVKCVMKTKKILRTIKCQKIRVKLPRCRSKHQKYRLVKLQTFKIRHCKCKRRIYIRHITCRSGKNLDRHDKCRDELPQRLCQQIIHHSPNSCHHKRHFRNVLCRRSCHKCTKCPKHSKRGFKIRYRSCLVTDRRYRRKFTLGTLKHVTYKQCKAKCHKNSQCKGFDFYITTVKPIGHCVFHKMTVKQLQNILYPKQIHLGVNYKDLMRFKANHCILSQKHCIKACPLPQLKKVSKCKCKKIGGSIHCFRKSIIFYHVISANKHCLKRIWKGLVPCGRDGCNDWKSRKTCQNLKRSGKCGNPVIMKLCKKTCTGCKCNQFYRYTSRKCDKTGHKLKVSFRIRKSHRHGQCIVIPNKYKISCKVCYKKPFKVIGKCKRGVRFIITIRSVDTGSRKRRCKVVATKRAYSCSKCPKNDLVFVTNCNKKGQLTMVTKYSVRVKGCCRYRLNSRKFNCKKCPKRSVRRTVCSEGKRMRHVYYYIRSHSHKHTKCIRKIYTKLEKCRQYNQCHNEMSNAYCKGFKQSGGCHKRTRMAHRLCKKSCGFC